MDQKTVLRILIQLGHVGGNEGYLARSLDSMLLACYIGVMSNIQVKNVSKSLHNKIRLFAKLKEQSISDFVLAAIKGFLAEVEWKQNLKKRSKTHWNTSAAALLEESRKEQEARY